MYAHNASTLLASKRRAVYYPPTGTGRDSYIMTDNGGTNIKYTCQGVPELGNYMKFGPQNRAYKPVSYTRFQKYASDGSGRDKYVVSKHGGQYLQEDEMNLKLIKFRNTMRDGGQWRQVARQKRQLNQLGNTGSSWRSVSTMKKQEQFTRTQRSNSNRLSLPRRVTEKYEQKLNEFRGKFLSVSHKNKNNKEINNEEVDL